MHPARAAGEGDVAGGEVLQHGGGCGVRGTSWLLSVSEKSSTFSFSFPFYFLPFFLILRRFVKVTKKCGGPVVGCGWVRRRSWYWYY